MKKFSTEGDCSVEGCESPIYAKRLCNKHYRHQLTKDRVKPCGCGCGEMTRFTYKHGHHTRLFTNEEQARRASFQTGDALRDTGLCVNTYRKRRGRHEHRIVAEQMLGRPLQKNEVVHHINGNKRDNRPENLQVMDRASHINEHRAEMQEAQRAKQRG